MANKKEILVHGTSRSGHHAVANWIYRQSPGYKCYINDANLDRDPFLSNGRGENRLDDIEKEKKEMIVCCFEDKDFDKIYSDYFLEHKSNWFGDSEQFFNTLVIRDPFNHFASKATYNRSRLHRHKSQSFATRMWKQHAKEYLGYTNYLPKNKICINFNKWVEDKEYRKNIAEQIGLNFTDEGREDVVAAGGGSSFNGMDFDGKASEMDVNIRWRHSIKDPYFFKYFDEEVLELSARIWGQDCFAEPIHKIKIYLKLINKGRNKI
jgi:hypothetical protein